MVYFGREGCSTGDYFGKNRPAKLGYFGGEVEVCQ